MRGIFLFFLYIFLAACGQRPMEHADNAATSGDAGQTSTATLTRVTLALNWFPEMEHGGFYAAQLNGHYKSAGLDVQIIPGGPGTQVIPQLGAGRVDFAIENADNVVLARARGIPVVAILAPIQTSPRCIIVHAASGITRLDQISNITLAMNVSNPFAVFLQKKFPLQNVRIVPYQGNTAQFLLDSNYAQQGYLFSEPYIIRQKGGDPQSLMLADAGFNPYTSVLITTEQRIKNDPRLVSAVARAAAQGWADYMQNPQPANEHIHKLNPQLGLDVLNYGAETLRGMVQTSETQRLGIGCMTRERWAELIAQMEGSGLINPGGVAPEACYQADTVLKPLP